MARERVFLANPLAAAGGSVITSPFQFVTTGEEHLRIESWCSKADVVVAAHYRYWDPGGQIQANIITHAANSDRTRNRTTHVLGQGALLNLTIHAEGAKPQFGECFVRVQIVRGFDGAQIVLGTLLQGYVTAFQDLGWPGSPIASSLEGPGALHTEIFSTPAAGVDAFITVPSNTRWRVKTLRTGLTCDATVATRKMIVVIKRGGVAVTQIYTGVAQVASSNRSYYFFEGANDLDDSGSGQVRLCWPVDLELRGGDTIETFTINIKAADQVLAIWLTVREWLEVLE